MDASQLLALLEKVRADALSDSLTSPLSAAWLLDHSELRLCTQGFTIGHPKPTLSNLTIVGGKP